MSLSSSKTRVTSLTRALLKAWDETKVSWRDSRARDFEQEYLEDLLGNVNSAIAVLDKLEATLKQIRRECE